MSYKVKEVADIAGVSVRTLHHYDAIDLLKPESVTAAGYRLYTEKDLEKLQQILFFKELDFNLHEIKEILENPKFDRIYVLKAHRDLLREKKGRLEKIINTVEKTINSIEGGAKMNKKEMFNGFNATELENHKNKYVKETKEKYGNSDAYKESERKTSNYKTEDWNNIMLGGNKIFTKLIGVMDKSADCPEVQNVVEEWRQYITDNFYNCTPEIFSCLGQMYIYDERFKNFFNQNTPGLAEFLSEAIEIYCANIK